MPEEVYCTASVLEWDKILHFLCEHTASESARLLAESLKPITDAVEINRRLRINSECCFIIQSGIPYPIRGCQSTGALLKKVRIADFILTIEEINAISTDLELACRLQSAVEKHCETLPELFSLTKLIQPNKDLLLYIRTKIDETGTIYDSATPELKKIRSTIRRLQEHLRKHVDSLVKQYAQKGMLQEEHYTLRNNRTVLPVKETHRRSVQGITHDISGSGATLFIEPYEIVERNNEISRYKKLEEEEIRNILADITRRIHTVYTDIETNFSVLTQLDFHYACGQLAYRLNAQKPVLTDEYILELRGARHPVLLLNFEQQEEVVPLTVTLGESFKTLVISGPNAGGKTVVLKTIGLLSMMVQCGLPVPADTDSRFPVFRRIIAEIGDPQSLDDNVSTFSARLLHLKHILETVSSGDLILLDELGTGTDPAEGSSLAMAVIRYITQHNALSVATTHHGSLKIFASEMEGVENASLAFDEQSLQPTYRLVIGVPGSSYALELAQNIGLPEAVLADTRAYIGDKHLKIEDFIRELESRISLYKTKTGEITTQKDKLDNLVAEYQQKVTEFKKEYHAKLEAAVRDSELRMEEFNRKFEHLVKEIREQHASREAIKKTKAALQQQTETITKMRRHHKAALERLTPDKPQKPREITVGSTVALKGYSQTGTVTAFNIKKRTATVQMDTLKIEVPLDSLVPAAPPEPSNAPRVLGAAVSAPIVSVSYELDIRGFRVEDALDITDKYLSDAVTSGLTAVRIIHGKGTGALRKSVGDFLKHDPRVKSYRLGGWGEGDTGVTIVELK